MVPTRVPLTAMKGEARLHRKSLPRNLHRPRNPHRPIILFSPKQKKIIQKLVESGYTFEREGGIAAVLKRLEGCGAGSLLPDLPVCASDPTAFTTPQSAKITAAGQLITLVNVPFVALLLKNAGEKLSAQWFHALYELVDLHLREFQLTCNELLQLRGTSRRLYKDDR